MKEIEIKVIVEHSAPLVTFLAKHGTPRNESHQTDEYFTPAHRDFTVERPVKEWLRLRTESNQCTINYKHFHFTEQGDSTYCDEHETAIADVAVLRSILGALDCRPLVTVRKRRQVWEYEDYEVAMDTIDGLGDFVEIEYKGKGDDFDSITADMIRFLKDVGCGKLRRNRQGYPFLLLFPDEAKYHDV